MGRRQLVIEVDDKDYRWLLKKKGKISFWLDEDGNKRGQELCLSTDAKYANDDYSITILHIMDLTYEGS